MSVLALVAFVTLQATSDAGAPTRIQVLVGEQPAPADTEVRLFESSRRALQQQLAGTQVVIAPFAWSSCRVRVVGGAPLGAAFAAWFSAGSTHPGHPTRRPSAARFTR